MSWHIMNPPPSISGAEAQLGILGVVHMQQRAVELKAWGIRRPIGHTWEGCMHNWHIRVHRGRGRGRGSYVNDSGLKVHSAKL